MRMIEAVYKRNGVNDRLFQGRAAFRVYVEEKLTHKEVYNTL